MEKVNYFLLSFILTIVFSCNKVNDNLESQNEIVCIDCLYGKWKLEYGIFISGNDTNMLYKDSKFHDYSYGVKRRVYDGYIVLNIDENQYEYIEYDGFWKDTLSFTENWKWLDTYLSKTHLNIRIDFNLNNGSLLSYKIIELKDNMLKVERIHQAYWGVEKMQLSFSKLKDQNDIDVNYSKRVIQHPANIIGKWELVEYEEIVNDSTFTRYNNDTVLKQFYSISGYNQIYHVKTYNKYYCKLNIDINEKGELSAEKNVGATWVKSDATEWHGPYVDQFYGLSKFRDYWNWVDYSNPHDSVYFFPLMSFYNFDYKINFINDNEFELLHELENSISVYYKYVRKE